MIYEAMVIVGFVLCVILLFLSLIKLAFIIFGEKKGGAK